MSLQEEIQARASKIYRDAYQMSIGELINLYKDEELDIHPEFQRLFRWTPFQKTRLIESIVLNIPIPPIFVSQRADGIWDVIDGVQRLSTIFEFVGIYKDENGNSSPSVLTLEGTEYLPSFEGVKWTSEDGNLQFSTEQKINFKRARIDVVIVRKESDEQSKYELFQRLNTGGSSLSSQEIRNCIMIMENRDFYTFITKLDDIKNFKNCIPISSRLEKEKYRMELILKLLVAAYSDKTALSRYKDITNLLNDQARVLSSAKLDFLSIKDKFTKTFNLLYEIEDENSFKRHAEGKASGAFLSSAYQGIAIGVYHNIDGIMRIENRNEWIREKIASFYQSKVFEDMMGQGVKPITRFHVLSELGKKLFNPNI